MHPLSKQQSLATYFTAALVIGSAIIVVAKIPPLFYGISLIGIIVFIAAAVLGLWLIFAIMAKKRL